MYGITVLKHRYEELAERIVAMESDITFQRSIVKQLEQDLASYCEFAKEIEDCIAVLELVHHGN